MLPKVYNKKPHLLNSATLVFGKGQIEYHTFALEIGIWTCETGLHTACPFSSTEW
jgi:hypothetical protein